MLRRLRNVTVAAGIILLGLGVPRVTAQAQPIGGYSIVGKTKVTGCFGAGGCQSDSKKLGGSLVISDDGTFMFHAVTVHVLCPDVPAIQGQWRARPSGTTILRGTNVRDFWAAVNACDRLGINAGITIHGRYFVGIMHASPTTRRTLRVVQHARAKDLALPGTPISIHIVGRFRLTPVADSASGAFGAS